MALGLAGHLTKLGKLESFNYMIKGNSQRVLSGVMGDKPIYFVSSTGNEMISVGVLLGIAASKRGSMDITATKEVATQLVALLPPSGTELPVSQVTQIAALISLGLLYEGTGHRHMTEVFTWLLCTSRRDLIFCRLIAIDLLINRRPLVTFSSLRNYLTMIPYLLLCLGVFARAGETARVGSGNLH